MCFSQKRPFHANVAFDFCNRKETTTTIVRTVPSMPIHTDTLKILDFNTVRPDERRNAHAHFHIAIAFMFVRVHLPLFEWIFENRIKAIFNAFGQVVSIYIDIE